MLFFGEDVAIVDDALSPSAFVLLREGGGLKCCADVAMVNIKQVIVMMILIFFISGWRLGILFCNKGNFLFLLRKSTECCQESDDNRSWDRHIFVER